MEKASQTLETYISVLHTAYTELIRILELQADDIAGSDEKKLSVHTELEAETAAKICSITRSVRTYTESVPISSLSAELLSEIEKLRKTADEKSRKNIDALKADMERLKLKMEAIKLPKTARRVYYSGSSPTRMDIEI